MREQVWRGATPRWLTFMVLTISLILGGLAYAQFLQHPRTRWNGTLQDRGGHYIAPQKLAVGIRHADIPVVAGEIFKPRRYPPLHAWLAAAILVFTGPHYILAVLPSLAGWILTATCGVAIVWRSTRSPPAALVAAFTFLAFFYASPAFRVFATDIFLESLGAGLTCLALLAWMRCAQEPSRRNYILLGLSLTLLFLQKYNYWLLALLAIAGDAAILYRKELLAWLKSSAGNVHHLLRLAMRHPLALAGTALFVIAGVMLIAQGPKAITLFHKSIPIYPPKFICTVAFWMIAIDLALWWLSIRKTPSARLSPAREGIFLWHALPVAIWCLLPGRVYMVMYFLSPANRVPGTESSFIGGAKYYFHAAVADYHIALWTFILAGLLSVLGLLLVNRTERGTRAVFLLLLISAFLTVMHPTHCSRFLHTWIPSLWIGASIAVAVLVARFRLPWWLLGAGAAALIVASAPAFVAEGHGDEPGQRGETTSMLDVTDTYLSRIGKYKHVTILSASGWPTCEWTYLEKFHNLHGCDVVRWPTEITLQEAAIRTRQILDDPKVDAIVVINAEPGAPWNTEGYANYESHRQVNDRLAQQQTFHKVFETNVPSMGATVILWERAAGSDTAPGPGS